MIFESKFFLVVGIDIVPALDLKRNSFLFYFGKLVYIRIGKKNNTDGISGRKKKEKKNTGATGALGTWC